MRCGTAETGNAAARSKLLLKRSSRKGTILRPFSWLIAASTLAVVLYGPSRTSADVVAPVVDPSPLTPEKIYLRAAHAMRDLSLPKYVTFREVVDGRNFTIGCSPDGTNVTLRHGDFHGVYDVSFRSSDGSAVSIPVASPTGRPCSGALLLPATQSISALGIPQRTPAPTPSPSPSGAPDAAAMGPRLIGSIRVEGANAYRIELVGRESLGTNDVYHLKLRAYRDPSTYPLTDLYVDPQTFLVREARGEVFGHYVIASARFAGVVDFDRVGSYWLVTRERFEAAANALLVHARLSAKIEASSFETPSDLPGVAFPTPSATPAAKPHNSATHGPR